MSIESKRLQAIQWILSQKEECVLSILEQMDAVDQMEANERTVVGYKFNGAPISKSKLIQWIKESEANMELGEFLTIDELEKLSEKW